MSLAQDIIQKSATRPFALVFTTTQAPQAEKTYQDLVIEHDTGGTELAVRALLDNGETNLLLGTISSTSRTSSTFRVGDEIGRASCRERV